MLKKELAIQKAHEFAAEFGRKPTCAELAKYAGISYSVVNHALRFAGLTEKIKPGRKQFRMRPYRKPNPDPVIVMPSHDWTQRIVYVNKIPHVVKREDSAWVCGELRSDKIGELAKMLEAG